MIKSVMRSVLPPVVTFFLILAVWEIVVRVAHIPAYLLPAPTAIGEAAWTDGGPIWEGALTTGKAAFIGFAASAIVGVLIAIALSSSRLIERAFYPFTVFFQTVPLIAVAPLLVVWCGYGLESVAIAAFIVAVFPVIANTLDGLRSTDPALVDLFRLYGAFGPARLLKLRIPSALPNIFTGLRISAGLAVIGAIAGEMFSSTVDNPGLGMLVRIYARDNETSRVFVTVGLAALLGLVLFGGVNIAGHASLRRWHASEQGR